MWSSKFQSFTEARLRALLPATPDRGSRRILRAGLTGVFTLLAKGMAVGINLLTLPLTSHYLGKERFGVWLTLSSLITWIAIADFGLNISLLHALATANGEDDERQAKEIISSAFWMISIIASVSIAICLAVTPLIDWAGIFNVELTKTMSEIKPAVTVVLILCLLRLPASVIACVYLAYQEGYLYQIWNCLSGLLAVSGLMLAIYYQADLPWLAAAFLGSMLLADLLAALYLFYWRRKWLLPALSYFNWARARRLLQRGGQFWIAHLSALLMLQADLIIVAWMFGAREVAAYGATLRLFTLIGAAQAAFTFPLWAAYGEAAARKDFDWLARTFKQTVRISLIWSIPLTCTMFVAIPLLFRYLVTSDIKPDWHLSLAMMVTEIINSVARCFSTLLNGLGAVRSQVIFGPIGGLSNLLLSWALGVWLGPQGVAWATAICLLVFWVGFMGRDSFNRLRRLPAA
jgi:O-antigen/teichoic acid export membrane protein